MKKGAYVLIFSSLAFLIASLLFLNTVVQKRTSDIYFDVLGVREEAGNCFFILDKSAKFALRDVLIEKGKDMDGKERDYRTLLDEHFGKESYAVYKREVVNEFKKILRDNYGKIIGEECGFDFNINDYDVDLDDNVESFTMKGKTEKKISFVKGNVKYNVEPSFAGHVEF